LFVCLAILVVLVHCILLGCGLRLSLLLRENDYVGGRTNCAGADYCSGDIRRYNLRCAGGSCTYSTENCGAAIYGSNYCSGNEVVRDVTPRGCNGGSCYNDPTYQEVMDTCDGTGEYCNPSSAACELYCDQSVGECGVGPTCVDCTIDPTYGSYPFCVGQISHHTPTCSGFSCGESTTDCGTDFCTENGDVGVDPFVAGSVTDNSACDIASGVCGSDGVYNDYCSGNNLNDYACPDDDRNVTVVDCNLFDACYNLTSSCEERDYSCNGNVCDYSVTHSEVDNLDSGTPTCVLDELRNHTTGDDAYCSDPNTCYLEVDVVVDNGLLDDCNSHDNDTCWVTNVDGLIEEVCDDYVCVVDPSDDDYCAPTGTWLRKSSVCDVGNSCATWYPDSNPSEVYVCQANNSDSSWDWFLDPGQVSELVCIDDFDNDCDGVIDGQDANCSEGQGSAWDSPYRACGDSADNDGDGLVDMDDDGCCDVCNREDDFHVFDTTVQSTCGVLGLDCGGLNFSDYVSTSTEFCCGDDGGEFYRNNTMNADSGDDLDSNHACCSDSDNCIDRYEKVCQIGFERVYSECYDGQDDDCDGLIDGKTLDPNRDNSCRGTVTGFVFDQEDNPVIGVLIESNPTLPDGVVASEFAGSTRTNVDGEYVLDVFIGHHPLTASKPGLEDTK